MEPAVRTSDRFRYDDAFARNVGDFYGKYIVTFESAHRQVRAHLFDQNGFLVAHVSFAPGYDRGRVDDIFVSHLSTYARENGYADRLRMVFS